MNVIHFASNIVFLDRIKHINLRYHFICTLLEDGQMCLKKIHTTKNLVDMLANVITQEKLKLCLALVGV